MIKYENLTLKNIYPKYITDYTDIDPTEVNQMRIQKL